MIKKKILEAFYPASLFLLDKFKIEKYLDRNGRLKKLIKSLSVNKNSDQCVRFYWCEKLATVFLVFLIVLILSLFITISNVTNKTLIDGKYINRPSYGKGDKTVNLKVNTKNANGEEFQSDIDVTIEERRYKDEDTRKIIEKAMKYIDSTILGKNKSLDSISDSLYLVKSIPNSSITIDWELDETGYINQNGSIENEHLATRGELTSIIAHIKYFETEAEYKIFLNLVPKIKSMEETFLEDLNEEIKQISENSITDEKLKLPNNIGDNTLYFHTKEDDLDKKIFFFGIGIAILIFIVMDKELEKKKKEKDIQLAMDYPEIINKFVLLLGAGMTIKGAWGNIIDGYKNKIEKAPSIYRYAYEEMIVTWHEMGLGISELQAYENFGKRINLHSYLKFTSFLTQNLQKGSKGLLEALEFEAMEAYEERKVLAKQLGEEAGTKLLGPMMIMLMIILVILLVPAFMTLGV